MAPSATPGEPREGAKPQPIGNDLFLFLFTLCTLCAVFLLWRRASSLRSVVGLQLKSWTGEGRIRLSLDDGPSAREFLEDDYDDDNEGITDNEPLAVRAQELQTMSADRLPELPTHDDDDPPSPPPKL